MIFVDASALIAIITGENDADRLSDRLEADPHRLCSALSIWESVAGLCRSYAFDVTAARTQVLIFTKAANIRLVTIGDAELELAVDAYARYGKGRHPAKLNMGDYFAYACAAANGATLLYKGSDFALTDLG